MKIIRPWAILLLLFFFMIANSACSNKTRNSSTIRVGYFPNIAHAQAVVGIPKGIFASHLGPDVTIKPTIFNAGPSIIEAIFSEDIDIAYIGPSPAINGYVRSSGKALKIISGVSSGGSLFIVRPDSNIKNAKSLSGKRIATPQLGNTQDIALRAYIRRYGLRPKEKGGTVNILPLRNPDILNLFMRKQIDGAWVPEPWATRLIKQAGGKIFLDERDLWENRRFCSTLMIVGANFLKKHPGLVRQWLSAHIEITQWINRYPEEAKITVRDQIKAISGIDIPKEIIDDAFLRLEITYDPIVPSLYSYAQKAYRAGFLGNKTPYLSEMIDLSLLNDILKEKSLPQIRKKKNNVRLFGGSKRVRKYRN